MNFARFAAFITLIVGILFPLFSGSPLWAKVTDKAEIVRSWKEMGDILDRNQELFDQMSSGQFTGPEEYEQVLGKLKAFLEKDLVAVQNMLAKAQEHGKTTNEINEAWTRIAGDDAPFEGNRSVEAILQSLERGLASVETGSRDAATGMVEQAAVELGMVADMAEAARPAVFARNRKLLEMAVVFDPGNQEARTWLGKVDEIEKATAAKAEKEMNEFVFPSHEKGFGGPGQPDQLAQAALDYFNSTCQPGEKAIRAAVVDKNWYCYKRNLLGEPVVWALTFMVAVQRDAEAAQGITRVWNVSFLTEERPGVAKAPPFARAAFNKCSRMRTSNLPK
ncbi:MAG TPA: hypothetical protein PLU72_12245 [Candidatus Ozemobacteraceae bacterium]|nr:hypothetical protein [Candidatus Ozemobacteraceae bacterium]